MPTAVDADPHVAWEAVQNSPEQSPSRDNITSYFKLHNGVDDTLFQEGS